MGDRSNVNVVKQSLGVDRISNFVEEMGSRVKVPVACCGRQ